MSSVGWDIGGAHVKLAYTNNQELYVRQWDCPLWKGLNELVSVMQLALNEIPQNVSRHHVTMTGELVDVFSSRDQGVREIMRVFLEQVADDTCVKFFSREGLMNYEQALLNTESIASANWIASGLCVSKRNESVIFVDMGSTTTDILCINKGELQLIGMTDFERLRSGELVYTGVVRSCVNTLCQVIPYKSDYIPLMAEYFAMSADVYRILGWLPEHADYGDTMDGQPKDQVSSMRRLARMIGQDYRDQDYQEWISVAEYIAAQQMEMIEANLLKQCAEIECIVGAGVGRFLIEKIAEKLSIRYQDFAQYSVPADIRYQNNTSDCAPAVALVFE